MELLLQNKIYPGFLSNYLYTYLIYELNKSEIDSEVFEKVREYVHSLINITKDEFVFIRIWKGKIEADKSYEQEKLEAFCDYECEGKLLFKKYIQS